MSTPLNLDRFLADLGSRRERLLRLVQPSGGPGADDLLQELTELSEQLIVADEELRVQQEELDSARRALVNLSAERQLLLRDSSRAYVVTDDRGVVVQATGAVQRLIRQPPIRLTPRPIATWFQVSDRRTVRAMISAVLSSGARQHTESVAVQTSDGSSVLTELFLERMTDAADGRTLLRWELIPAEVPDLHLVPNAQPVPEADRLRDLLAELAAVARLLDDCRTTENMYPAIVAAALRLVPGAAHVGLVLRKPAGAEPVAWSSEEARRTDTAQLEAAAGPLVAALGTRLPSRTGQPAASRCHSSVARGATAFSRCTRRIAAPLTRKQSWWPPPWPAPSR
jgi:PAS domain S-box-containing protein